MEATLAERVMPGVRSQANSIEGGTSEVQLNVVAKQVLGLHG